MPDRSIPLPRAALHRLCARAGDAAATRSILIVAAHPDDEVIGCGARLWNWRDVNFLHVTDGAPRDLRDANLCGCDSREAYARLRQTEFHAALTVAGLSIRRSHSLGCVDQEASFHITDIAREIVLEVQRLQPESILTHPYEGGHPDHDATACAVHIACELLRARGESVPALFEFTSYHNCDGRLTPCEFLPAPECDEITMKLAPDAREFKRRLFDCYRSQRETLAYFPLQSERFRTAPRYDFTRAPHAGTLFYEMFDWGMTGERFGALAADALERVNLEQATCV